MAAQAEDVVAEIVCRIVPVARADPRVCFVYLFGSVVHGDMHPSSDVDLAVWTSPKGSLLDNARLRDDFAAVLEREVDLVLLGEAPLWLQFRVLARMRNRLVHHYSTTGLSGDGPDVAGRGRCDAASS